MKPFFLIFILIFSLALISSKSIDLGSSSERAVIVSVPTTSTSTGGNGSTNSSNYWDDLDTPNDITTFIRKDGGTTTTSLIPFAYGINVDSIGEYSLGNGVGFINDIFAPTITGNNILSNTNLTATDKVCDKSGCIMNTSTSYFYDGAYTLYFNETKMNNTIDSKLQGTSHDALSGRNNPQNHPQYLLLDGTNNMTGNLIVNANVTIQDNLTVGGLTTLSGTTASSLNINTLLDVGLYATANRLYTESNLYMNSDGPETDSCVYFYDDSSDTSQGICWDDANAGNLYSPRTNVFEISNSTAINGNLTITTNNICNSTACFTLQDLNYSTAGSGDITDVLGDSFITNGSSTGLVQLRFNETKLNQSIKFDICYQEFSNTSTDCGGLNTGTYINSNWNSAAIDGNFYSQTSCGELGCLLTINYSLPSKALNTSLWKIKDNFKTEYLSIPNRCWRNPLSFYITATVLNYNINYQCYNGTNYETIIAHSNGFSLFEEAMIWVYDESYETISSKTFTNCSSAGSCYMAYLNYSNQGNLNVSGYLDVNGNIALGNIANVDGGTSHKSLILSEIHTSTIPHSSIYILDYLTPSTMTPSTFSATGVGGYILVNQNVTFNVSNVVYGLDFGTWWNGSAKGNTNLTLYGARIFGSGGAFSTGVAGNVYGLYSKGFLDGFFGGITASNMTALYVADSPSGITSLTNHYGIQVEKPTTGTNKYQVLLHGNGVGSGIWFNSTTGPRISALNNSDLLFNMTMANFQGTVSAQTIIDRSTEYNKLKYGNASLYLSDVASRTTASLNNVEYNHSADPIFLQYKYTYPCNCVVTKVCKEEYMEVIDPTTSILNKGNVTICEDVENCQSCVGIARDIGGSISWLRQINYEQKVRIDALQQENSLIKSELCKKDRTYPWCLGLGL